MRFLPALLLLGCTEYTIAGFDDATGVPNPPALKAPTQVDRVKQGLSPQVDVLWVLDNSGSMREEQEKLARNLSSFLEFFLDSGLSWHMGVITTDVGEIDQEEGWVYHDEGGMLLEAAGYRVLTDDIPNIRDLFANMVRVGVSGSFDEAGIEATYRALRKSTPEVAEANRGINRPGAALHVIVVSDENDRGERSEFEFADYLRNLKADPDTPVTFSSIVGPGPRGCSNAETDAAHGARYISVTDAVGGLHFSICEDDWEPILRELGGLASGIRKEFFLSKVPTPGTVRVKVRDWDGVYRGFDEDMPMEDLPPTCSDDESPFCFRYRFDQVRNSLSFVGFVPTPLAEIEIHYTLLEDVAAVEDEE